MSPKISRRLDDILYPVYSGYIEGLPPKISDSLVELQKWAYNNKAKRLDIRRMNHNITVDIKVLHSYMRTNIKEFFVRVI